MELKELLTQEFKDVADGSFALDELRNEAFKSFEALGFPTTKNEEWKYTNVRNLIAQDYKIAPETTVTKEEVDDALVPGMSGDRLVFVNGRYSEEHSDIKSSNDELVIEPITKALSKHAEVIGKYYNKIADHKHQAFTALSTAFATDGTFIHVQANKALEQPVSVINIIKSSDPTVCFPRNLIIAGENAQVKIIETTKTIGDTASLSNKVSELYADKYARIEYYKIQDDTDNASQITRTVILQEDDSNVAAYAFTLNGGLVRNDLNMLLDGEHAESHMYGVYMLNGKTHCDNHTSVDHKKPNSFSNELYRGILDDKSRGVFNGKIFVRQPAQKTNAFQANNNILLSDDAVLHTKPQLEIWADDVSCSHGATSGQLDTEAMFYLRSRGISYKKAQAILLEGFISEVVHKISIAPLKDYMSDIITKRLHE